MRAKGIGTVLINNTSGSGYKSATSRHRLHSVTWKETFAFARCVCARSSGTSSHGACLLVSRSCFTTCLFQVLSCPPFTRVLSAGCRRPDPPPRNQRGCWRHKVHSASIKVERPQVACRCTELELVSRPDVAHPPVPCTSLTALPHSRAAA